jgi:tricorn protease
MLKADATSPFEDREGLPGEAGKGSKEERPGKGRKGNGGEKDDEDGEKEPVPVVIDWAGLPSRVVEVDVDAGVLRGLGATSTHLFWFSRPVQGIAQDEEDEGGTPVADLVRFDLEEEEEEVFASGVSAYDLEPSADRIAYQRKRGEILVVEAGGKAGDDDEKDDDDAVSLEDVVVDLDPREEWRQIFHEGWRNMRDFHWTRDMAGVDWQAARDRYAALLPRLAIRDDLRDLMGELIGELATSHTYVWGGDPGVRTKPVSTGLLGGRFVREGAAYRIERIFRGDPADLDRSPLSEPGVNVREGEYVVAVNRRPFAADRPFEAAFENLAGRRVVVRVAADARGKGARDVVVTPAADDARLRYVDWVRSNREEVARATGGRVGYIHIPDMGAAGLTEFNRWFYPQLDKEGMVVDCRWNRGGFVSQMLVERLRRKVVSWDRARGGGYFSYPLRTLIGPFVVLTNEQAGSDGDIFPYACQYEGLAPVIGERSWGGVVGIRGDKPLVDGGQLTQPEYAWWDARRGWAIENHGVDPDIEVVETPQDAARGVDAQLRKGIDEVLRRLAEDPPQWPTFEDEIPDKIREGFRRRELGG